VKFLRGSFGFLKELLPSTVSKTYSRTIVSNMGTFNKESYFINNVYYRLLALYFISYYLLLQHISAIIIDHLLITSKFHGLIQLTW